MTSARPKPRTLRQATASSLAADAATVEAVDALRNAGTEPLLLKGPALAQLLYERGEERSWDDADLLVDPSRYEDALAVLATLGFVPAITNPLERGTVSHAISLVRPGRAGLGKESIDLHRSFDGVRCSEERFWTTLQDDRGAIELFGRSIPVPAIRARLALVAVHAACHGAPNLRSLGDLRRAVTSFGAAEWSEAADLAATWRAEDYFVVGLRLDPAGSQLLAALEVSHQPNTAALMRGEGMPRAQRGFEQLSRTKGFGARIRLTCRKVFPSPEVMRTWQPLASRGTTGLLLAYLWRPPWLIWQVFPVLRAYLKVRRG